jgi:hypothetical protein
MRKLLLALLAIASTIAAVGLTAGPASALGGERLGCYITPTSTVPPQLHAGNCSDGPGSTYQATFGLMYQNGSYGYTWSVPAEYASHIYTGCTTNSERCTLTNLTPTSEITVSVTITQSGQSATLSATAYINQWCGQISCA